jgi:hypothetical protein
MTKNVFKIGTKGKQPNKHICSVEISVSRIVSKAVTSYLILSVIRLGKRTDLHYTVSNLDRRCRNGVT